MNLLQSIEYLNENTKAELVKLSKKLPESYSNIFADIKNAVLDIYEIKHEIENKNGMYELDKKENYEAGIILIGEALFELCLDGYNEGPEKMTIIVPSSANKDEQIEITAQDLKPFLKKIGNFMLYEKRGLGYGSKRLIMGTHKKYPEIRVEIITKPQEDENMLEQQLSIYEFYSNGKEIYATNKALEAMKKKEIIVNEIENPVNALHEAELAKEKYGFALSEQVEKELLEYIKYKQLRKASYEEGVLNWGMRSMEREPKPEFVKRIQKKVENIQEKDIDWEKQNDLEQTNAGRGIAKYRQAKERAELNNKGRISDSLTKVNIGKTQPLFTQTMEKDGKKGIEYEDLVVLRDMERIYWKQIEIKELFVKSTPYEEMWDHIYALEEKLLNCVSEMGYKRNDGYMPGGRIRELTQIVLEQATHGLELTRKQRECIECNIGYRGKDVKKILLEEAIQVRPSKEMWDSHMKYEYDEEFISKYWFDYGFKQDEGEEMIWQQLTITKQNGESTYQISGLDIFLMGDRKEKFYQFLESQIEEVKSEKVPFIYGIGQLKKTMKSGTKRYTVLSEKEKNKAKELMEERWVQSQELPF